MQVLAKGLWIVWALLGAGGAMAQQLFTRDVAADLAGNVFAFAGTMLDADGRVLGCTGYSTGVVARKDAPGFIFTWVDYGLGQPSYWVEQWDGQGIPEWRLDMGAGHIAAVPQGGAVFSSWDPIGTLALISVDAAGGERWRRALPPGRAGRDSFSVDSQGRVAYAVSEHLADGTGLTRIGMITRAGTLDWEFQERRPLWTNERILNDDHGDFWRYSGGTFAPFYRYTAPRLLRMSASGLPLAQHTRESLGFVNELDRAVVGRNDSLWLADFTGLVRVEASGRQTRHSYEALSLLAGNRQGVFVASAFAASETRIHFYTEKGLQWSSALPRFREVTWAAAANGDLYVDAFEETLERALYRVSAHTGQIVWRVSHIDALGQCEPRRQASE